MLLSLLVLAPYLGYGITVPTEQKPLQAETIDNVHSTHVHSTNRIRPLHGRFLHITDFHPDEFYKPFSSTEQIAACHRGEGPAGIFGAETSDCDSPFSLVNATFRWINDNLKDSIDFVIWTGDSARHDSDEELPRKEQELLDLNEMLIAKFTEVFGKDDNINDTDPTNDFIIPIVPTFGNNDIMPHNILDPGPNRWTRTFTRVWRNFIPESQRHSFERGGWFYVEVIPNQLAVFSLNTLYFFNSNTAVDGCAKKSEPGYEHMEWLRVQLQFLRQRGMKAIMMGHVPPARTENKNSWDETCWQKYALWMRQYRDVVVGSLYGHMNIDHFMLQDFKEIRKKTAKGRADPIAGIERGSLGDELTIESSAEYLTDLRHDWSKIPDEPVSIKKELGIKSLYDLKRNLWRKKKHQSKKERYLNKIGGEWTERYSVSTVTASVVPNFFPSMRVIEYNISGIDAQAGARLQMRDTEIFKVGDVYVQNNCNEDLGYVESRRSRKKRKGRKKKHHPKPIFTVPDGPSKSSPPGPAYSPQTFTWLGYTQYYANLTRINNDFHSSSQAEAITNDDVGVLKKWREGKHKNKKPKHKPDPQPFKYEVEYDTKHDKVFGMPDLTVRSWLDLARRIGEYKPARGGWFDGECFDVQHHEQEDNDETENEEGDGVSELKKRKRKKKHHHRKATNRVWFAFVRRAFVGTWDDEELHEEFGDPM